MAGTDSTDNHPFNAAIVVLSVLAAACADMPNTISAEDLGYARCIASSGILASSTNARERAEAIAVMMYYLGRLDQDKVDARRVQDAVTKTSFRTLGPELERIAKQCLADAGTRIETLSKAAAQDLNATEENQVSRTSAPTSALTPPSSTSSDEMWVCNFPDAPGGFSQTVFWLHEKTLQRIEPIELYDVSINNDAAIVAAAGEGNGSGIPGIVDYPTIGSDTVAINRKTGDAVVGYVSIYGPNKAPVRGSCHRQTG